MANNLFLPEKKEIEIEHSLSVAGTYNWIAPDKNRDGSNYTIELALYGGGGGAPFTGNATLSGKGGSGGFISGYLEVEVGGSYSIVVGGGGAQGAASNSGGVGGNTRISYQASEIVRADGGSGGEVTEAYLNSPSGSTVVSNAIIFTSNISLSTFRRNFNGDSSFYIYNGSVAGYGFNPATPDLIKPSSGGVGGNHISESLSGSQGRAVLRYKLKENVTDNPPV